MGVIYDESGCGSGMGEDPAHQTHVMGDQEAALQAAADANGGYINGKTKQIVIAALNSFGPKSPEAHRHAVALRQCSLFAADVGEHIVKAMTDAADFLDRTPPPLPNLVGDECQYAKDQGVPEHRCAVRCVYEDQTIGNTEARSTLWNFAINAGAALIENNIIMDTSVGKVLSPRQDGNRDGLHYATAIRGLAAAEGQKAALQAEPISDDSLQARIGGIGNEIHNLGCEHHKNEELAERLGELASSLWSLAASVANPSPPPKMTEPDDEHLWRFWNEKAQSQAIEIDRLRAIALDMQKHYTAATEALEPFAAVLDDYDPEDEDDFTPGTLAVGSVTNYEITLGDLRRARAALTTEGQP